MNLDNRAAAPSPALFFDTVNSYQRTAALKAAIELDVFSAIAAGRTSARALAGACGAAERGVRILCDYLVLLGFLTKNGATYALTPDSAAFLDRQSPSYLGGTLEFLLSPVVTGGFTDLAAAVRKGGTAASEQGTVAPVHPVWVTFARAMAPLIMPPARAVAELVPVEPERPLKVLDIAAGHGMFGIVFAQRHQQAQVVAVDWAPVLEVAREHAAAACVSERYRTLPGSAFEADLGAGYDIVLVPNFLHHFDWATCVRFLRRTHAALIPGGRVITVEFVPNEDRVSPPPAAAFSLMMLGTTPSGDAYSFAELEHMCREAGFCRSELHPLPPSMQHAVVSFE